MKEDIRKALFTIAVNIYLRSNVWEAFNAHGRSAAPGWKRRWPATSTNRTAEPHTENPP